MNNKTPMVLACIDGSKYSNSVCDYASWISKRVDAPLKLLHNIESREETLLPSDLSGALGLGSQDRLLKELMKVEQQRNRLELEKGRFMLRAAEGRTMRNGVEEPLVEQRRGGFTESLIELEDEIRVLVLGIRGEEHADNPEHLGTHLEKVARSLHRPILVVNRKFTPPERIMLAYDGSEGARKALAMVARSLLFKGLPCHLVHVSQNGDTAADQLLAEAAATLAASDQEVVTAKLTGNTGDALCAYQAKHQIDMTLMGAFSHTRLREFLLGSFTARMLLTTRQPVLLLR